MNFQEFVKKKETLLSEISELSNSIQLKQTSDRTTAAISQDFGTVLNFVSDWDLNSQKMPQASTPEDTQGWKVKLANDMVGRDNSRVDATKENLASKIPQLAQQMAAAIGKFIQAESPGTLDFSPLYSELDGLTSWGIDPALLPRFKIMLEKSVKLSVTNANASANANGTQPYAMMGDQIVRKDAHTQKGTQNKDYVANTRKNIDDHGANMSNAKQSRNQGRQNVMQRHGEIDDQWNQASAKPAAARPPVDPATTTVQSPVIKRAPQQTDDDQFAHIGSPVGPVSYLGPPQQHQSQQKKKRWGWLGGNK